MESRRDRIWRAARSGSLWAVAVVFACIAGSAASSSGGVLVVHPENRLYFGDGSGRAIWLGGHQIFVDLQDNSFNKPLIRGRTSTLDWSEYLEFLDKHGLNYVRSWIIWSTGSGSMAAVNKAIAYPMPYQRVAGHGRARDGGYKFDLDRFDEAFFARTRRRCEDLQQRGVYVSIMLFEVYGFLNGEACGQPKQTLWDGNVFNRANNINGIDSDFDGNGNGIEFFYTKDERIRRLQRRYVRKVIDTVNDLDNVFYEVANELYAPSWQYEIVQFVKQYERGKAKQHIVLLSSGGRNQRGGWQPMDKAVVVGSPADCFAVSGGWDSGRYRRADPPANRSGKPGIVDMDHVRPGSSDTRFVWTALTRGYHFNLYDKPFEDPGSEGRDFVMARLNVGKAVEYASKIDLAHAGPHSGLASTGFCLARPGWEYIVYQPGKESFDVSGLKAGRVYRYQWYGTEQAAVMGEGVVRAAESMQSFSPPAGRVVLFLQAAAEPDRQDGKSER